MHIISEIIWHENHFENVKNHVISPSLNIINKISKTGNCQKKQQQKHLQIYYYICMYRPWIEFYLSQKFAQYIFVKSDTVSLKWGGK